MTTAKTSQGDLVAFLDYLADKGLMNAATASARKAAVRTLFSALDPSETADVTTLNLDEVAMRFLNKRGGEFKPESVKVYKSRVASSIADFKKYRADPLNFKVAITPKVVGKTEKSNGQPKEQAAGTQPSHAQQQPITTFVSPSEIVFPIPIRPNVIIKIMGLPSDLTRQEAARIANVIHALATVDDPF
ncbi:hypothetical protein [Bradyrhizobium sp.]|uniref:hypothetical protein n=1 Tax=Bradyrhizobium sp. TaxID=376 RepID=UPI001D30BCAF|nr:hypothetical protein [Bradyrhizobium sp.]MBI5322738.1 hypothetical protein [Bradyrhizobium sp.]